MTKRKSKKIKKSTILAIVAAEDPTRYKYRVVKPEKGKGKKKRPRKKKWVISHD